MEITLALAALKVVGYGLAAIGPGIGIGIATYGLCTAAARQPEMKGTLMGYFFIGAAMSEALALLGLVLFLIGAGVAGGSRFVEFFHGIYFVYGVIMTVLPMVVGYLFAKYVLKLSLLNNLGSITGGMTSTPALGTLLSVSKTETVAASYPIALISVVIASQVIILTLS